MSQMANVVLYDGTTTHTFVPVKAAREGNKTSAFYREDNANVAEALQARMTQATTDLPSGVKVVESQVVLPIGEAVSGVNASGYTAEPKVAHEPRIVITGYFHPRSTGAEREKVRLMAAALLAGLIAGSWGSATGDGPAAESIDSLINPT